jgi:hypothetical protein
MNTYKVNIITVIISAAFFMAVVNRSTVDNSQSCPSALFDYQQTFNVSHDDVVLLGPDKIVLSQTGGAFYCETGDQINDIHTGKLLCATQKTLDISNKQRVFSESLSSKHFSKNPYEQLADIRHQYQCDQFIAHKVTG